VPAGAFSERGLPDIGSPDPRKRRIAELEAALDQANALNRRCIGAHEASLDNTILQRPDASPAAVLGVTVAKPQASGGVTISIPAARRIKAGAPPPAAC
jgi:hypothetical protein